MEPHTFWLPYEITDKEEITFVLLAYYGVEKIEHTDENIAIASPMLRRAVREHRRWITQIIRDIITSNLHRRCLHEYVEDIADNYVADVSTMCRHFEPWCTSSNARRLLFSVRRCLMIYRRWFLATKYRAKISMHVLIFFSISRCIGEAWRLLAYVGDHSPNCNGAWWRCPNLCIAKARGLKKPRGTVA